MIHLGWSSHYERKNVKQIVEIIKWITEQYTSWHMYMSAFRQQIGQKSTISSLDTHTHTRELITTRSSGYISGAALLFSPDTEFRARSITYFCCVHKARVEFSIAHTNSVGCILSKFVTQCERVFVFFLCVCSHIWHQPDRISSTETHISIVLFCFKYILYTLHCTLLVTTIWSLLVATIK